MPVRQLMYAAKLYDKYIQVRGLNIYGKSLIRLPLPKLVTFYNGLEGEGDKILSLSEAFESDGEIMDPNIEVKTRMININHGSNPELMRACEPLAEYAWLVERIRENRRNGLGIEEAVDRAINDMPEDYEIRKFLIGNRAEVKDLCVTKYNEAETMKRFREEGREEGRKEGRKEGEESSSRRSAQKMLADGVLPLEKIAEYSSLPLDEVKRLRGAMPQ